VSQIVEIENYKEHWESEFHELRDVIENEIGQFILSVEHVGSTAVKGLGAKPILDIDIVVEDYSVLSAVIQGLEKIGYFHQENWSFKGREAFGRIETSVPWNKKNTIWMEHHLYVCNKDSEELARHMAFRNYLREHPEAVIEYDQLKRNLANIIKDRTAYTLGKTNFVNKILEKAMKSN
jgi:GrpB-like predicted nucleotidyltransferase (UPF0157 family)